MGSRYNDRAHVVVATYADLEIFTESLQNLGGFNKDRDRIIVMDSGPVSDLENKSDHLSSTLSGYKWTLFHRRNWNLNHGGQLDYLYLLSSKNIQIPEFTYFIQDHYLNLKKRVKDDTIPAGQVLDLDQIAYRINENPNRACYLSRNAFKFSTTSTTSNFLYPKTLKKIRREVALWPIVDGGNFGLNPKKLLEFISQNQVSTISGNGHYGFCHVWEHRLGKLLIDSGYTFHPLQHNLDFWRPIDLEDKQIKYQLEHQFRPYFRLYGKDLYRYKFNIAVFFLEVYVFLRDLKPFERWAPPEFVGSSDANSRMFVSKEITTKRELDPND